MKCRAVSLRLPSLFLVDIESVRVLKISMAFWSVDTKSPRYPSERPNDIARELNDAASCGRSAIFSTPAVTQAPPRTNIDDSLPSPGTPLRQRRLPASFWQEPNVPRRPGRTWSWRAARRSVDVDGRMTPQSRQLQHQQSPITCQPVGLLDRRPCPYPSAADLAFSAWRATDGSAFLRDWKNTSGFNFDVAAKPAAASYAGSVDWVRQFAQLSPLAVVGTGLPGYPLLSPDFVSHGGPLAANSQSEDLAASAAVLAAYLRWRAAEEGFSPAVEPPSTSPPAVDWPSITWRPCPTAGAGAASVAVQRFHRYRPY